MNTEKLAFVFIGLLLFILGFDALMGVHYIKNLSGPALIAIASIVAGTFLACMAAWFCCKPNAPTYLKIASFSAKVLLILVGGLSATAVITLYFHKAAEAKTQQIKMVERAAETEQELAKKAADNKAREDAQKRELDRINTLKDAALQLRKVAGARAANSFIEKNSTGITTATPQPDATPGFIAAAQGIGEAQAKEEEKHTFKQWLLEYADSGIYYVPTMANLLVFIGLSGVLLFGSGATGKTSTKQQPGFVNQQPAGATASTDKSPKS